MSSFICISSSDLSHVIGGGNVDLGQVASDAKDGAETGGMVGTVAGAGIAGTVLGRKYTVPGGHLGAIVGMGAGGIVGAGASVVRQATAP